MELIKIKNGTLLYTAKESNKIITIILSDLQSISLENNKSICCALNNNESVVLDVFANELNAYEVFCRIKKKINYYHTFKILTRLFKSAIKFVVYPAIIYFLTLSIYSIVLQNSIFFQQILMTTKGLQSNDNGEIEISDSNNQQRILPPSHQNQAQNEDKHITNKQLGIILQDGADKGYTITLSKQPSNTKLFVFTDPLCRFCQKLEPVLNDVKNLYSIELYPVNVISGEKVLANLNNMMCTADKEQQVQLWKELILGGYSSDITNDKANEKCSQKIIANSLVFRSLKLSGTPAVFTNNGIQIPNEYLENADTLKKWVMMNNEK